MSILGHPFDRQPVPIARVEDLDLELVRETIAAALQLGRDPGPTEPFSYLERYHGIVGDGDVYYPTVAGIMAFSHEPDRWLTSCGIDIALFESAQTSPTRSKVRQLRGPIFRVIDETVALLQEHCTVSWLDGARLVSELDTPLIVLRELSTNAVVHRDLSIYGSQVRIQAYPRYIEWLSPGGLPANITIDTLLTAQFARNPSLAQFLFHAGYIEKFGMGLDAVIDALRQAHLSAPAFYDDKHSFRVRVQRAANLLPGAPDMRTREGRFTAILELFAHRRVWQQHELLEKLNITRSTLQRDLMELVQQRRLVARGATKNRVYIMPEPGDAQLGFEGFASDEAN